MKCPDCSFTTNSKKGLANHLRNGCSTLKGSWVSRNKEYLKKYGKDWRKRNIEKVREYNRVLSKDWRKRNPDKVKASRSRTREKLRSDVLQAYGNVCKCCGEQERKFLCIDHINNDGAKHRKEFRLKSAQAMYTWLRKNNYPQGFQILCYNCNCAKAYYGRCPHE